jgi:hypothetical protein
MLFAGLNCLTIFCLHFGMYSRRDRSNVYKEESNEENRKENYNNFGNVELE